MPCFATPIVSLVATHIAIRLDRISYLDYKPIHPISQEGCAVFLYALNALLLITSPISPQLPPEPHAKGAVTPARQKVTFEALENAVLTVSEEGAIKWSTVKTDKGSRMKVTIGEVILEAEQLQIKLDTANKGIRNKQDGEFTIEPVKTNDGNRIRVVWADGALEATRVHVRRPPVLVVRNSIVKMWIGNDGQMMIENIADPEVPKTPSKPKQP
jgi:hypothetical protein